MLLSRTTIKIILYIAINFNIFQHFKILLKIQSEAKNQQTHKPLKCRPKNAYKNVTNELSDSQQ